MKASLLPLSRFLYLGGKVLPFCFVVSLSANPAREPADFVDPFIGTAAHGHTFPGAAAPFGLMQLSPDTGVGGWDWCSGYHYSDSSILGFSHTHLSGTGIGDLGNILFVPQTGRVKWLPGTKADPDSGYRARFSHQNETASPGYYRVQLDNSGIVAELSAGKRAGIHRYTFPRKESAALLIDLSHKVDGNPPSIRTDGGLKVENPNTVSGWQHSNGWSKEKTFYFVAEFSEPITKQEFRSDDQILKPSPSAVAPSLKGAFYFEAQPDRPLVIRVGLSPVSLEGARKNLEAEAKGRSLEELRSSTRAEWNTLLSRMKIETTDLAQKRIFYTSLYHSMLAPNLYNDVDGSYVGIDRRVHANPGFDYYSTFSLWDTFRAANPLYTLIVPEKIPHFLSTFLKHSEQARAGILPIWPLCANETNCMVGYHAIPVIVDAYFKGFRGFDAQKMLAAMKKSANFRQGHEQYGREGFAPAGGKNGRGVSTTLEYSYDDWCLAQFASALGAAEDEAAYRKRSQNYRNIFDAGTGFMRGRDETGKWLEPFDPLQVDTKVYAEGNSWQWSWSVMHDIPGLIELMGGPPGFLEKLDQLWITEGKDPTHELVDLTGLIGQYAHGNEPSHHVAYLYNFAGEPWKTQKLVRQILNTFYSDKPDGVCGNEDCGQMSAWYLFSAFGFYPVNPASGIYMIGAPLFPSASIDLSRDGKTTVFTVTAENSSPQNPYIQSASLNGQPLDRAWITYRELIAGGTLAFVMGPEPEKKWAASELPPPTGY